MRKHASVCEYELIHIIRLEGLANGTLKVKTKLIVMTQTNTFAGKLGVAFVAIAMALMMVAPAQAETAEELQAKIDALMATIASLQSTTAPAADAMMKKDAYVFTRSLTIGSQGADVTALQTYLIGAGHAIPAGATGYFGAQTASAVAAWQTANGVMPAAGYFGPVSQAKYTALMAAMPDDSDDDDSTDDDDSSTDLQGEASLKETDLSDGDDTEIEEGQEAAPVAELELEFENGDANIDRIDVSFVDTGSEEDPWDTFDEVSLWVDGDEVASMDVSDEDNWLDEDAGTLRFSGIDVTAMEDEAVTIVIGVTVQNSVDDMPATWNVDALNVRYTDADDVTTTDTITEASVDFTIQEMGGDDELAVKVSPEDPDATTIQVDVDEKSDWTTVFAYDLDSDDSTNDIMLNGLTVAIVTPTDVVNQVVSDIQLVIDGEEFDDVTWTNDTTASATAMFDIDGDLTIDAGDRITVEVQVEFAQLTGNYDEGETIFATTTSATIDAEGADDLAGGQLTGSATGETHTLRSAGVTLDVTDSSVTSKANTDSTLTDDEGVFVIEFDVTAFDSDLYIDDNTLRGLVETNTGVNYTMVSSGAVVTTGTTTATLDSDASLSGGRFLVSEGETESFTLTVEFDPLVTGAFKLQLHSVNFNDTNADADTQQLATPAEDFDTSSLTI